MREIPLTQGRVALVDDEDYDWLSQWRWQFLSGRPGYATRNEHRVFMHRAIMQAAEDELIGHRNGNTLDNRRANLYRASRSDLGSRQRIRTGGLSRYKGVTWDRANGRWRAMIQVQAKRIHLGYFGDEVAAARAYDAAALHHFGPAAVINFAPTAAAAEECEHM